MENLYHVSAALSNMELSLKSGSSMSANRNGNDDGGDHGVCPNEGSGSGDVIDIDNISQGNTSSLKDTTGVDIITTL